MGRNNARGQLAKILIACHELLHTGGIFRFERFGRVARRFGHEVAFVRVFSDPKPLREIDLPVLTLDEARARHWDATMIPGAGFPTSFSAALREFRESRFGKRVQHVLNDQSKRAAFLKINARFAPDIVIFNNLHWPAGSYSEFRAGAFDVLVGAVDVGAFAPARYKQAPTRSRRFIVGGLANKNPAPTIEAVRLLRRAGRDIHLRLFGRESRELRADASDLIDDGTLQLSGLLSEPQLPAFYRDLDCVVHTERNAGWANVVAEAMASGVPVICTPHGTVSIAEPERTALVIPEPSPRAIAVSIDRLRREDDLAVRLSHAARSRIAPLSWENYAADLWAIIASEARSGDG